jgi:hypothetical protein
MFYAQVKHHFTYFNIDFEGASPSPALSSPLMPPSLTWKPVPNYIQTGSPMKESDTGMKTM